MKLALPAFSRSSLLLLATLVLHAQSHLLAQAPPTTDIWLASVSEDGDGTVLVADLVRVTDRAGYDNQPNFLPDGRLAFTSMDEAGKTDILVYDTKTKTTEVLIRTPENDYSATPVPGKRAASIIRDYGNENQQLWSIPISEPAATGDGGQNLLPDINPVGYHAWVDPGRILLFVLGDPPTLRLATVGPGPGRILANNPGRALAQLPGTKQMTFVHKLSDDQWWLSSLDPDTGDQRRLFRTLPGREDYAWSPAGWVLMGDGSNLYQHLVNGATWQEVADLKSVGLTGITRMSFCAAGDHLAIVAERLSN